MYNISEEEKALIRATAVDDPKKSAAAMNEMAKAFQAEWREAIAAVADYRQGNLTATAAFNEQTPLRRAVFREDLIGNIFTRIQLEPGASSRFPLDFIAEGEQDDFMAFVMPKQGYIPENHVEGDEIYINTYRIANSIDWDLAYARDARWDVISRAFEAFRAGFVGRLNDDGWHVILAAALATGEMVTDSAATAGVFTKELVSKMKTRQRRRTLNGLLTDLYVSPEAFEDMRAWTLTQVDDVTRREIFVSEQLNGLNPTINIFGVNIRDMRELGVSQEYQLYYTSTLSGSLGGSGTDTELVVGLDLAKDDSFVMPVREDIKVFDDPVLHRQGRAGIYGWSEIGLAALDGRRVLPGSF